MARLAIVYQDDSIKTDLTLIGKLTADRLMSEDDSLRAIGVDMDKFAAEQGWDGWNPEQVIVIDASDDDEIMDKLVSGDKVPTTFASIETPNGMRSIEMPALGEPYDALRIASPVLYDADCTITECIGTPRYSLVSDDDLIVRRWVVLAGRTGEEEVVDSYTDENSAIDEAQHILLQMSTEDKKTSHVIVVLERSRIGEPICELTNVWIDGGYVYVYTVKAGRTGEETVIGQYDNRGDAVRCAKEYSAKVNAQAPTRTHRTIVSVYCGRPTAQDSGILLNSYPNGYAVRIEDTQEMYEKLYADEYDDEEGYNHIFAWSRDLDTGIAYFDTSEQARAFMDSLDRMYEYFVVPTSAQSAVWSADYYLRAMERAGLTPAVPVKKK